MVNPSTPTTNLTCDSKPSTVVADIIGKEQDVVEKTTVEQATTVDGSSYVSLTTVITDQARPTPTVSNGSSPAVNATPDTSASVPETPLLQDDDDDDIWIPKGDQTLPNATPTRPAKPSKPKPSKPTPSKPAPSKPKRND